MRNHEKPTKPRLVLDLTRWVGLCLSALLMAGCQSSPDTEVAKEGVILIKNGLVIDGTGSEPLSNASILIENGRFKEVSTQEITAPAGAVIVDATGKTILPGLIDMHAHLLSGGFDTISEKSMSYDIGEQQRALKQMLYWGVTAVYDPVQPLDAGLDLRNQVAESVFPSPRLFISGPGFTAPGGWAGSMDPKARYEPKSPEEIKEQVGQLAVAKVDILKLFYDDMGHAFTQPIPKLEQSLLESIIREAHAKNLKVMVHAYETENHKQAMAAGADIMAHSAVTAPIDDEYIDLAKKSKTLYVATLSVYHDVFNKEVIREFIRQDFVQETVPGKTLATLAAGGPLDQFEETIKHEYFKQQLPIIMANLKKAYENGIPIAVGPDTGVPGSFPGIAVHREMELMVQAGVPPAAVLVAATKSAAHYLGQDSLGTIEEGKTADLLIVDGDPRSSIKTTRNINVVIKNGRIVDREKLLDEIMKE